VPSSGALNPGFNLLRKTTLNTSTSASLTPEEPPRLLNAAEPSVLPYIAIGVFAGLRAAERDHLDWKDAHLAVVDPYIDLTGL